MLNTIPHAKLHRVALLAPLGRYLLPVGAMVGLLVTSAIPVHAAPPPHHHYKLVVIGTFGGPNSLSFCGFDICLTNRGAVVGQADTTIPDPNFANFNPYVGQNPFLQHAFKWQNGTLTDLGALPGPNTSQVSWITEGGAASGVSTRSTIDPLTGWPEAAAILWTGGQIIDLGTLGGFEASALANNSRGQVAGGATNTIPDSFPSPLGGAPSFGTQARAFLWEKGVMQDLGDLGGPDAVAMGINERGQIAGLSYTSSTPNPATGVPTVDPFLWENGKMIDLGGFGGTFGGPSWLNERGQVVGSSNLPGNVTQHPFLWDRGVLTDLGTLGGSFGFASHANDAGEVVGGATNKNDHALLAFLWKAGVMTNLGTLDGDLCSLAGKINSGGQIVGQSSPGCSFSPGDDRAVLWETDGSIIDLNAFVPAGLGLTLFEGSAINDRGEIVGEGFLSNGDARTFLLIPCDDGHPNVEGCDYSLVDAAPGAHRPAVANQSHPVSKAVLQKLGTRPFGIRRP
jgi:probable HAF family extracellular repeat protein